MKKDVLKLDGITSQCSNAKKKLGRATQKGKMVIGCRKQLTIASTIALPST